MSCSACLDILQVVKITETVTAACPYPALRLDKLYAALIRCLVLWTVTKQILVSCFKGLYLFVPKEPPLEFFKSFWRFSS